MIDYYYEFQEGTKIEGRPLRYGLQRGYHPEESGAYQHLLHSHCYTSSRRIWLENANGMILVRENGRDVHQRINHKEVAWIKLVAREL